MSQPQKESVEKTKAEATNKEEGVKVVEDSTTHDAQKKEEVKKETKEENGVGESSPEKSEIGKDQEIRVSTKSETRVVISKIIALFTKEKCLKISLLGLGNAISKTARISEILAFRVPDLKIDMFTEKVKIERTVTTEGSEEKKEEASNVTCLKIVMSVDSPVQTLKESKRSKA